MTLNNDAVLLERTSEHPTLNGWAPTWLRRCRRNNWSRIRGLSVSLNTEEPSREIQRERASRTFRFWHCNAGEDIDRNVDETPRQSPVVSGLDLANVHYHGRRNLRTDRILPNKAHNDRFGRIVYEYHWSKQASIRISLFQWSGSSHYFIRWGSSGFRSRVSGILD